MAQEDIPCVHSLAADRHAAWSPADDVPSIADQGDDLVELALGDILAALEAAQKRLGDYVATLPDSQRPIRSLWRPDMDLLAYFVDDAPLGRDALRELAIETLRVHGQLRHPEDAFLPQWED